MNTACKKTVRISEEQFKELENISSDWNELKEGVYIQVDSIKSSEDTEFYRSIVSVASIIDDTFYHHNQHTNEVFLTHKHEFGVYGLDWFLVSRRDFVRTYKK